MISVLRFISTALHRLCDALGIPYYCEDCGRAVKGQAPLCEGCRAERNAQAQRGLCQGNVDFDTDADPYYSAERKRMDRAYADHLDNML